MSYSDDRSSGGGAVGVAGAMGTILLICVIVGLKITARTAGRALSRQSYNNRYENRYEPPPGDPNFHSCAGARQTSSVVPGVPTVEGERIVREQAEQERRAREQAEQNAQRKAESNRPNVPSTPEDPQVAEQKRQQREEELARLAQRDELAAQQRAEADQREREAALRRLATNPLPRAQQQLPANPDVPPGFPVTAVDQVKARDVVFAPSGKGWLLALVQWRRGAMVQVRFVDGPENSVVEQFSLMRIRLQVEPAVAAAENPGRPEALRPVVAARDPANTESEDDALVVARPRAEVAAVDPPAAKSPARTTPARVQPTFRQWTNDTGEFKVDAELVTFEFDLVQLKKRDGKVITIRIDKLSAADQALIREQFP